MRRRRTLRARLTASYAAGLTAAGAVLVVVMYVQVAETLGDQPLDVVGVVLPESVEIHLDESRPDPFRHPNLISAQQLNLTSVRSAVVDHNAAVRQQTMTSLLRQSLLVLIPVVLLSVAIGWLVASRALAPLHRITATARRVADDSLDQRIALTGPADDIKHLADTFDAMLERLDRSFDGQRRFVANASHELRTPLTINRTVLEVALGDEQIPEATRALGEKLLAVNARHERLIDGLLTLASAEQGLPVETEADLADLVRLALPTAQGRDGTALDLRLDLDPAPLRGDPLLLERLVQNLLDNAVRHNMPDGFVTVRTWADGEHAALEVANSGPGVPPERVETLFEPFQQFGADGDDPHRRRGYVRGGVGIGLSIVRAVATAHGGSVTARARDTGGLRIRARLPTTR